MWLRLKPLAIFCSMVGFGSRSPAICSIVNWSNGMLRLNASITQSRQGHMSRCAVDVIAVRVRVARIEPLHRHALAVARGSEKAIDTFSYASGDLSARKASTSAGVGAARSDRR